MGEVEETEEVMKEKIYKDALQQIIDLAGSYESICPGILSPKEIAMIALRDAADLDAADNEGFNPSGPRFF